jgi:hypothetical protein
MPRKGDRDVVWDAFVELFGPVSSPAARGRRNKAVRQVKDAIVSLALTDPDRFPRDDRAIVRELELRYARIIELTGRKPTDLYFGGHFDEAKPESGPAPTTRENALELLHDWKRRHP